MNLNAALRTHRAAGPPSASGGRRAMSRRDWSESCSHSDPWRQPLPHVLAGTGLSLSSLDPSPLAPPGVALRISGYCSGRVSASPRRVLWGLGSPGRLLLAGHGKGGQRALWAQLGPCLQVPVIAFGDSLQGLPDQGEKHPVPWGPVHVSSHESQAWSPCPQRPGRGGGRPTFTLGPAAGPRLRG